MSQSEHRGRDHPCVTPINLGEIHKFTIIERHVTSILWDFELKIVPHR